MTTASETTAPPAPGNDTAPGKPAKSIGVLRRRWRKFRTLKRGWYSFLILMTLYLLSWCAPLMVNGRALVVSHEGELSFPALAYSFTGKKLEARTLGQRRIGETHYRQLAAEYEEADNGDWVLMAPYPYGPIENLLREEHLQGNPPHGPSPLNWMGTDDRGRDVFARLIYGFRISITFALSVVFLAYLFGMSVGGCLGFFGGRVDFYGQRVVEIWAGLPFLYTIIIVSSIVRPDPVWLVFLLSIFSWIGISFYMRGEFYREKSKDYVAAAVAQGESNWSIMFRHILPNSLTPIISFAPFAVVGTIVSLVALDFLGFGIQPPTPSWGELVNQAKQHIFDWHLVFFPLGALFGTLILVVFIGEAIREAFDPKVFARLR